MRNRLLDQGMSIAWKNLSIPRTEALSVETGEAARVQREEVLARRAELGENKLNEMSHRIIEAEKDLKQLRLQHIRDLRGNREAARTQKERLAAKHKKFVAENKKRLAANTEHIIHSTETIQPPVSDSGLILAGSIPDQVIKLIQADNVERDSEVNGRLEAKAIDLLASSAQRVEEARSEVQRLQKVLDDLSPSPDSASVASVPLPHPGKGGDTLYRQSPTLATLISERIHAASVVIVLARPLISLWRWMEFEYELASYLRKPLLAVLDPQCNGRTPQDLVVFGAQPVALFELVDMLNSFAEGRDS